MHRYLMTHVPVHHLHFMYVLPPLKAARSATTYLGDMCCYY